MKFTIDRLAMMDYLGALGAAVQRSSTPRSQIFAEVTKEGQLWMLATNIGVDHCASVEIPVGRFKFEPGQAMLLAGRSSILWKTIADMKRQKQVTIEVVGQQLRVGNTRLSVNRVWSEMDNRPREALHQVPMRRLAKEEAFVQTMGAAFLASSRDSVRTNITSVLIQCENEKTTYAATDGRRLVAAEGPALGIPESFGGVVIPNIGVAAMLDILRHQFQVVPKAVGFLKCDGYSVMRLSMAGFQYTCRLSDVPFPEYRSLISSEQAAKVGVDRRELARAIRGVLVMGAGAKVIVDQDLRLITSNPEMGEATYIVKAEQLDAGHAQVSTSVDLKYLLAACETSNESGDRLSLSVNPVGPIRIDMGKTTYMVMPLAA